MNDDIRPMTPPNGGNDMLQALIMGGTLGCHGAISQPSTMVASLPALPVPLPTPVAYPVAPKRSLPPPVFPVAPEPVKRLKLGEGPWKHAGLMSEYGGVRQYLKMVKGEIPWPPTDVAGGPV